MTDSVSLGQMVLAFGSLITGLVVGYVLGRAHSDLPTRKEIPIEEEK
jgi:hypothetical protein